MPVSRLWLRWSGIGLGGVTFLWLSIEDVSITGPVFLAVLFSLWGGIAYRARSGKVSYVTIGFWSGLCVSLIGMLLMVFKMGLHDHNALDFTVTQFIQMLRTTPFFTLSGWLLGWGIKLWELSHQ